MVFPIGWQLPKNANNLRLLNNAEVKEDKQIIRIDNRQNLFPGVAGAEWVNIILWKRNSDNGLNGLQRILTNGENEVVKKLNWHSDGSDKPLEIQELVKCIKTKSGFVALQNSTSVRKPYGFSTDVLKDYKKYNLVPFQNEREHDTDIKIYCKGDLVKYVPKEYSIPKLTKAFDKFKVFVPYAWGNMSENYLIGGAFSDIILAAPYEICLETYLESGCFNTLEEAKKHAKYLMTDFVRAAVFSQKVSQHSTSAWGNVPTQTYNESWWSESIEQICEHLYDKYEIPNHIREYIRKNIQKRTENNIRNYNE